jgi:hypothetical protein
MSELVTHCVYFGAAVSVAVLPFKYPRSRAAWARWVFFTISGCFMSLAVCGLLVDFHYMNPSKLLTYYLQGVRGFLLGCTFVLLVSGEFVGKKISKDKVAA